MVFVSTETETEALLLETNYIKQLKPRFNVLMRDDKSFPYILLTRDHVAPQITKHRGARTRKGDYFGPFATRVGGQPHAQRAAARLPSALVLRLAITRTARGPACSTRSSAARVRAQARFRISIMPSWCRRRAISCPAKAAPCASCSRATCRRPPSSSSSSAPRGCATASPRSPRSRARRASIRRRSRRRTFSPSPNRPGSSASRCFSSAPSRTGAIAPTFRAPIGV